MTPKYILDVDTGIDDALAIAYALAQEDMELLGITVTYGNTPIPNSYRNTKELLSRLGRSIPVYSGAEGPLDRLKMYSGAFHGQDGLGETLGPADEFTPSSMSAAAYMIEMAHKHGNELIIITTGPITNLALALRSDPSIAGKLGRAVVMGGAVTTPGNVTRLAEANIYMDPEAANIVFDSELPVTLVGLDVTRKTLLTYEDMQLWRETGTSTGRFFAEFTRFYLDAYKKHYPFLRGCALHDPLAVAAALHPEWVRTIPMHLRADPEEETRGRTTENLSPAAGKQPNVEVCVQVDAQAFMKDFYERVESLF